MTMGQRVKALSLIYNALTPEERKEWLERGQIITAEHRLRMPGDVSFRRETWNRKRKLSDRSDCSTLAIYRGAEHLDQKRRVFLQRIERPCVQNDAKTRRTKSF